MSDHRAKALNAIEEIGDRYDRDLIRSGEATAHALLYVGDQVAALVEQQTIANVIAAAAGNPYDSPLVYARDDEAVITHIRDRVSNILDPDGDNS